MTNKDIAKIQKVLDENKDNYLQNKEHWEQIGDNVMTKEEYEQALKECKTFEESLELLRKQLNDGRLQEEETA